MSTGPVVIAFDGSAAAQRALRAAATLMAPRPGLVVVVWEAGLAFDLASIPSASLEMAPAAVDYARAADIDRTLAANAEEMARRGAAIATELGMVSEALAVADELTVGGTLVRVVKEVDAAAVVVGRHERGALHDFFIGSTTKELVKHSPCPVLVVRDDGSGEAG
ncbi:universal stress protein [Pseudonocardia sp.]|uniref:universal stress protein n=1 Tax=Pseudonocardia sp. TaxID=60912 RepID=UPI003D11E0CA